MRHLAAKKTIVMMKRRWGLLTLVMSSPSWWKVTVTDYCWTPEDHSHFCSLYLYSEELQNERCCIELAKVVNCFPYHEWSQELVCQWNASSLEKNQLVLKSVGLRLKDLQCGGKWGVDQDHSQKRVNGREDPWSTRRRSTVMRWEKKDYSHSDEKRTL